MTRSAHISRGALIAVALLAVPSIASAQYPTKAPPPGAVKPAAIPPFQEAALANGLRLMLVESRRQPVLSLALMIPAGDSYDPTGKEGLATIAAGVITKGAGARSADQVSSAIEGVGGSMSAGSGNDFLTVRANVLSENAPLAFALVADAVSTPTFATKEVELARTQTLSGLQLQQSSPSALASRYFASQLFGTHPYGKYPTPTTVRGITVDDLRAFQRTRLVPRGALLVVAGNIDLATARKLAEQSFGAWSGTPPVDAKRAQPVPRSKTEILLVHRPGSVQSNIIVGNLTLGPTDDAYFPLSVASKVLGGGSEGRLFKTLREQKSWTYGAYSQLTREKDIGWVALTAEVRNAVTDSALKELLKIERSLSTTPVPKEEFDGAISSLVGSMPLQLETAQGIAEQAGRFAMLGLPKDYLRTRRVKLANVTTQQLQSAAKSLLRVDESLIIVVGDGAQVYDKLASIAPTRIVSVDGDAMQPSDLVTRTTSLPVDMTKLAERADSFTVMLQGNPAGFQNVSLSKTATGFTYRTAMSLGAMMSQTQEATFGSDLKPQAVKGSGSVQGMTLATDLTYANGRVKGSTSVPGQGGVKTVNVDTTVANGVLDANMVGALVPGLPWAPNAKFTASAFDASAGMVRQLQFSVVGTETVTVPAGAFPVYRVDATGGQAPSTMYITTAAPHRVVKLAPAGAPIEFVLVK